MPEELYPNLYRLKIPLPESPLKHLNAYIVKGEKRSLIIDTGLRHMECKAAMLDGLRALGIELSTADYFITHFHEDHFGLLGDLVKKPCTVFFNKPDMAYINLLHSLDPLITAAVKNGYPENQIRDLFSQRSGLGYGDNWRDCLHYVKNDDVIEIGGFQFICIHTPGHTLGHTCLYEKDKQILISGDHVLDDISPNIPGWYNVDPLGYYLESLDKLRWMDVTHVLPGHREPFWDLGRRIDELKLHHKMRLKEITDIVDTSHHAISAYDISAKMKWDIQADSWEDFPLPLKFHALGEAVAHLRYLENREIVRRNTQTIVFLSENRSGNHSLHQMEASIFAVL